MEAEKLRVAAPFLLVDGVLIFVMVMLLRLDWIVNDVLYGYSLVFSVEWAVPYWTVLRSSLAMLVLAFAAVSVIGYGSYMKVKRESEKVVFVCKSCGTAWVELDKIPRTKSKSAKVKVLKTCPSCGKKLPRENGQIVRVSRLPTEVETSVSDAEK
jgi:predicted RNA-binding Zn-ribbon protein involved in translation (DUF1610 family)